MADWLEGFNFQVDGHDFQEYMKALRRIDRNLYNAVRRELRYEASVVRDDFRDNWTRSQEPKLRAKWGTKGKPLKSGDKAIQSRVGNTRARIYSRSQSQKYLNAGFVRHPGVTNPYDREAARARWYTTDDDSIIRWWDDEAKQQEPLIFEAFTRVLDDFAVQVSHMKNASTSELWSTRAARRRT